MLTTGAWLAQLIRTEQERLITETVEAVRATVPSYDALPTAQLRVIFTQAYTVFALNLETDDMGPWETYFQGALAARQRAGIAPAGMISTIAIVQQQVLALAERHSTTNPIRIVEARSILRATANRLRMLISKLNLAHLTGTSSAADPAAS